MEVQLTTLYIYNPSNILQGMTNNVGLTNSVGDTICEQYNLARQFELVTLNTIFNVVVGGPLILTRLILGYISTSV